MEGVGGAGSGVACQPETFKSSVQWLVANEVTGKSRLVGEEKRPISLPPPVGLFLLPDVGVGMKCLVVFSKDGNF